MSYTKIFFIFLLLLLCSPALILADDRPDKLSISPGDVAGKLLNPQELSGDLSISRQKKKNKRLPRRSIRLRRALGVFGFRFPIEYRTIDGANNNLANPHWGRAFTPFKRMSKARYNDGHNEPMEKDLPSPRAVSNSCSAQDRSIPSRIRLSNMFWQFGQLLDHDFALTPTMKPAEPFMIEIPEGDRFFDPLRAGDKEMKLERSTYMMVNGVREQINTLTAFIDASHVYGSESALANELRELDGTGRLKVSEGDMLPFNVNGFPVAPTANDPTIFLAGDFRVNEQLGLTAIHTLFVREHNYWAHYLRRAFPRMSGDRVYHLARAIVAAETQHITYEEFLPLLIGKNALPPYTGYKPNVNPTVANEFTTGVFRLGHTLLPSHIHRLGSDLLPIPEGPLALRGAFFQPRRLLTEGGIDPVLRGLSTTVAQDLDIKVIDDVRNFLFGPPGSGGFDLVALNLQRSREHGLSTYNQVRRSMGLRPRRNFSEISSNPENVNCLAAVYSSIEDVDLWIAGIAEDPLPGALLGETFTVLMIDQFTRFRDGDRFWYENYLPPRLVRLVKQQTMSKIIRRNTGIGRELQDNAFIVP
jgi:peroxidase